ncbi:MAG TPA: RGCVC family protein [Amycolatopsis sp.]|jgi:hypothetical protein
MTAADAPAEPLSETPVEPLAENACPSCPHPLDSHDVIARRFCTATSAGHLDRGCVCGAAVNPHVRKKP